METSCNSRIKLLQDKSKLRKRLLSKQMGVKSLRCALNSSEALCDFECCSVFDKTKCDSDRISDEGPINIQKMAAPVDNSYSDLEFSDFVENESGVPRNDYCQNFVNTGQRPQNFIRDSGLSDRFEEYPKLRELIKLKDEHIVKTNCPPIYIHADLADFNLAAELDCLFDVILLRPPLHVHDCERLWTWEEIRNLEIEKISAQRSFVFLWCGSGEGLDEGRTCLRKWGFRRCEDICWIKTNKDKGAEMGRNAVEGIFQRTKEHCLMGIKGTVRRSTDGDFIHANVDIDLIISEDDLEMPDEIFNIIEHFCLGRRRLHLFGKDSNIRPGWLTVGLNVTNSNFDKAKYKAFFEPENGGILTGSSDRIELLRPKSPTPKMKQHNVTMQDFSQQQQIRSRRGQLAPQNSWVNVDRAYIDRSTMNRAFNPLIPAQWSFDMSSRIYDQTMALANQNPMSGMFNYNPDRYNLNTFN